MTDTMNTQPLDAKEFGKHIMKISVGFAPAFLLGMGLLSWPGLAPVWRGLGATLLVVASVVEVKRIIGALTHMACPRCTMELTRKLTEPAFVCIPCNTRFQFTPPQK